MTTLTFHTKEDEQRQLHVTVEVAEERVQKAMKEKARQLAREIQIPGFRPGKVPYQVVERRFGKEVLRAEAVEDMIDDVFTETLEEIKAEPYAQTQIDNMELDPLKLMFIIPLEPTVNLGNYRDIRREVLPVEVTDEAVEDALEHIRTHHEVIEPVDRPVEIGDLVTYSGTAWYLNDTGEKQFLFEENREEALMDPEQHFHNTPFVENLLGLETGDQKEFSFVFAENYEDEDIAGREVNFDITVLDVQTRELPELNDDLAQLEGDYETLDELRASLRTNLEKQAEEQARDDFFDAMMKDLAERVEINYPPAALEAELDKMVADMREQVTRIGWEWDDYLRLQGKTEEKLREEWHERAEKRLRDNLILLNFIKQEKIVLNKERLDEGIEQRLAAYDPDIQADLRDFFLSERGLPGLSSEILMNMVVERMEAIAAGTAPELAELVDEEDSEAPDEGEVSTEEAVPADEHLMSTGGDETNIAGDSVSDEVITEEN